MGDPNQGFLQELRQLSDVLMYTFDFEPLAAMEPARGLTVHRAESRVFACDATGGQYVLCRAAAARSYVVHLEARGVLRVLGTNLPEAVRLLVELPYFRELLALAGARGLEAMREEALRLEREVSEDILSLPDARRFIASELGLPELSDPIAHLYRLGVECPLSVVRDDGFEYLSELRELPRRTA